MKPSKMENQERNRHKQRERLENLGDQTWLSVVKPTNRGKRNDQTHRVTHIFGCATHLSRERWGYGALEFHHDVMMFHSDVYDRYWAGSVRSQMPLHRPLMNSINRSRDLHILMDRNPARI